MPPPSSYADFPTIPISGFDPALLELAIQPGARWTCQDRSWRPTAGLPCPPSAKAWRVVSVEGSQAILNHALALRVSFNSLCLSVMNRLIAAEIAPDSGELIWQIPVNLRGAVQLLPESSNQFCAMDLRLDPGADPGQVEQEMFLAMCEERPWYFWKLNNIGRQMGNHEAGLSLMRELLQWRMENEIFRVGLFSNIGKWKYSHEGETSQGSWLVGAPVTYLCPFSLTLVTVFGKLGILLQAHCSLDLAPSAAEGLLDQFVLAVSGAVSGAVGGAGATL